MQHLNTRALIDVAGLMAVCKNSDAAQFFAELRGPEICRGVVYFDTDKSAGWCTNPTINAVYPWKHLLSWKQNVLCILMKIGAGNPI